jgi:hypothetical protein
LIDCREQLVVHLAGELQFWMIKSSCSRLPKRTLENAAAQEYDALSVLNPTQEYAIVVKKPLTKRQEVRYDKVLSQIRDRFGSYESIARKSFIIYDEEITGNTIRVWFLERRISTDFCFILYEMMGRSFPICDLLPWLIQYFVEFHQLQGESE